MDSTLKWAVSLVCGIAGYLWGDLDGLMMALIIFIVMDYITGLIVGYIRHELSSETGFRGLCKKLMIFAVIAVAHILDTLVLGSDRAAFRSAAAGLYIANEGLSILENAGKIGVPLPKPLVKALEQLKDKSTSDSEEDENNV